MNKLNKQLSLEIERILTRKGVTGRVDMGRVAERVIDKLAKLIPAIIVDSLKEEIESAGKLRPCKYWKIRPDLCQLNGKRCEPGDCEFYRPMWQPKSIYFHLNYRLKYRLRRLSLKRREGKDVLY